MGCVDYSGKITILSYFVFLSRGVIFILFEEIWFWTKTPLSPDFIVTYFHHNIFPVLKWQEERENKQKKFARSCDKFNCSFPVYFNWTSFHSIPSLLHWRNDYKAKRFFQPSNVFAKGACSFSFNCCDKWSNVRFNQVWRRRDEQDTTNNKSNNRS